MGLKKKDIMHKQESGGRDQSDGKDQSGDKDQKNEGRKIAIIAKRSV